MDTQLLKKAEKEFIKSDIPRFGVGDTISVHTLIKEGAKTRIQIFEGIVLAIKGSGLRQTFTIRKISHSIGVEKIFPMNSPNIKKIEFIKKGKVRRSKLYYMRERVGKQATKITQGEVSKKMAKQHATVKAKAKTQEEKKEAKKSEEPQKESE